MPLSQRVLALCWGGSAAACLAFVCVWAWGYGHLRQRHPLLCTGCSVCMWALGIEAQAWASGLVRLKVALLGQERSPASLGSALWILGLSFSQPVGAFWPFTMRRLTMASRAST